MTRYFTPEHEWIEFAPGDTVAGVGITVFAQGRLGDITYVELPAVGAVMAAGDSVAVIDSVKAASDIYAPVGGAVVAINPALDDQPELVNTDAEGEGWLWRMTLTDPAELDRLLDEAAYLALVAEL